MSSNVTWKDLFALQLTNRSSSLVLVESFLMILINFVSAVGNVTLCYVIYKTPSLQTRTNIYVITLAVSDTLMALCVMPLNAGVLIHGKWIFGNEMCQIQGFILLCLGLISLQTMALIAINRYFCVVRSSLYEKLFSKKRSSGMVAGIWVVAVVTAIAPLVLRFGCYQFMANRTSCFIYLPEFQSNIIYTSFCLFVFILVPFCAMVCCYTLVFRKIHQHKTNNTFYAPSARSRAQEIKNTRLLFVLVAGFSACWVPCIGIELSNSILPGGSLSRSTYMAYGYLIYLSSALNPVLYGTLNRPFRRATVRLLLIWQRSNGVRPKQVTQQHNSSLKKLPFNAFIRKDLKVHPLAYINTRALSPQ